MSLNRNHPQRRQSRPTGDITKPKTASVTTQLNYDLDTISSSGPLSHTFSGALSNTGSSHHHHGSTPSNHNSNAHTPSQGENTSLLQNSKSSNYTTEDYRNAVPFIRQNSSAGGSASFHSINGSTRSCLTPSQQLTITQQNTSHSSNLCINSSNHRENPLSPHISHKKSINDSLQPFQCNLTTDSNNSHHLEPPEDDTLPQLIGPFGGLSIKTTQGTTSSCLSPEIHPQSFSSSIPPDICPHYFLTETPNARHDPLLTSKCLYGVSFDYFASPTAYDHRHISQQDSSTTSITLPTHLAKFTELSEITLATPIKPLGPSKPLKINTNTPTKNEQIRTMPHPIPTPLRPPTQSLNPALNPLSPRAVCHQSHLKAESLLSTTPKASHLYASEFVANHLDPIFSPNEQLSVNSQALHQFVPPTPFVSSIPGQLMSPRARAVQQKKQQHQPVLSLPPSIFSYPCPSTASTASIAPNEVENPQIPVKAPRQHDFNIPAAPAPFSQNSAMPNHSSLLLSPRCNHPLLTTNQSALQRNLERNMEYTQESQLTAFAETPRPVQSFVAPVKLQTKNLSIISDHCHFDLPDQQKGDKNNNDGSQDEVDTTNSAALPTDKANFILPDIPTHVKSQQSQSKPQPAKQQIIQKAPSFQPPTSVALSTSSYGSNHLARSINSNNSSTARQFNRQNSGIIDSSYSSRLKAPNAMIQSQYLNCNVLQQSLPTHQRQLQLQMTQPLSRLKSSQNHSSKQLSRTPEYKRTPEYISQICSQYDDEEEEELKFSLDGLDWPGDDNDNPGNREPQSAQPYCSLPHTTNMNNTSAALSCININVPQPYSKASSSMVPINLDALPSLNNDCTYDSLNNLPTPNPNSSSSASHRPFASHNSRSTGVSGPSSLFNDDDGDDDGDDDHVEAVVNYSANIEYSGTQPINNKMAGTRTSSLYPLKNITTLVNDRLLFITPSVDDIITNTKHQQEQSTEPQPFPFNRPQSSHSIGNVSQYSYHSTNAPLSTMVSRQGSIRSYATSNNKSKTTTNNNSNVVVSISSLYEDQVPPNLFAHATRSRKNSYYSTKGEKEEGQAQSLECEHNSGNHLHLTPQKSTRLRTQTSSEHRPTPRREIITTTITTTTLNAQPNIHFTTREQRDLTCAAITMTQDQGHIELPIPHHARSQTYRAALIRAHLSGCHEELAALPLIAQYALPKRQLLPYLIGNSYRYNHVNNTVAKARVKVIPTIGPDGEPIAIGSGAQLDYRTVTTNVSRVQREYRLFINRLQRYAIENDHNVPNGDVNNDQSHLISSNDIFESIRDALQEPPTLNTSLGDLLSDISSIRPNSFTNDSTFGEYDDDDNNDIFKIPSINALSLPASLSQDDYPKYGHEVPSEHESFVPSQSSCQPEYFHDNFSYSTPPISQLPRTTHLGNNNSVQPITPIPQVTTTTTTPTIDALITPNAASTGRRFQPTPLTSQIDEYIPLTFHPTLPEKEVKLHPDIPSHIIDSAHYDPLLKRLGMNPHRRMGGNLALPETNFACFAHSHPFGKFGGNTNLTSDGSTRVTRTKIPVPYGIESNNVQTHYKMSGKTMLLDPTAMNTMQVLFGVKGSTTATSYLASDQFLTNPNIRNKELYAHNLLNQPKHISKRSHLPSLSLSILEAPSLQPDYYLSLVDWGKNGYIAIILGQTVYLYNPSSEDVLEVAASRENLYPSAVKFSPSSDKLAVAVSDGTILVYDVDDLMFRKREQDVGGKPNNSTPVVYYEFHQARVNCLDWYDDHTLTSGGGDQRVLHTDLRCVFDGGVMDIGRQCIGEVMSLSWNRSTNQLALGTNDNVCQVYHLSNPILPQFEMVDHCSAVKSLSWSPHNIALLATGAGSMDKHLRVYDCQRGILCGSQNTGAQISSVNWSLYTNELITTHGFDAENTRFWDATTLAPLGELRGHTDRILGAVMDPTMTLLTTVSCDETIRFWDLYQTEAREWKRTQAMKNRSGLGHHQSEKDARRAGDKLNPLQRPYIEYNDEYYTHRSFNERKYMEDHVERERPINEDEMIENLWIQGQTQQNRFASMLPITNTASLSAAAIATQNDNIHNNVNRINQKQQQKEQGGSKPASQRAKFSARLAASGSRIR